MVGKVLISERPNLIPIFEFQHHSRIQKNTEYAINCVKKAISRNQMTIKLDEKKLNHKVFKSTSCYMYNRLGEPMKIQYIERSTESAPGFIVKTASTKYNVVEGTSRPQHGDKFNRFEGRQNALRNACSSIKLLKSDPNFSDLLTVKRFINTFELETSCTSVSYQFMDLWLAIFNDDSMSLEKAIMNYVGKQDTSLKEVLVEYIETVNISLAEGNKIDSVDKYLLFKSFVKQSNPSLF